MDRNRKKELREQYKSTRPQMGIFMIRCRLNNKCYIQATPDLRGVMNGARARLAGGMHPYLELQQEWTQLGADNFTMEILEELAYDPDESKTDYKDELAILEIIWAEKLAADKLEFYQKRR